MNCYRVNYYKGGQPATAFVVAETDTAASNFLGVQDGSASVTRIAGPVEVVGLDAAHAPLPAMPVTIAPFELPKAATRQELDSVRAELDALKAQVAGQGKAV